MYQFTTKLEPFARGFLSEKSPTKIKKMGAGLVQMAKECKIKFDLEHGFVFTPFDSAVAMNNSSSVYCFQYTLDCMMESHPEDKEDLRYIKDNILLYTKHKQDFWSFHAPEHWKQMEYRHLDGGNWMGHGNPDFYAIGNHGTEFYHEKVAKYRAINPDKGDFYDAIDFTLNAMEIMGERIHDEAESMLDSVEDADERRRLTVIRDTFDHAPKKPCRNFAEGAIVFMWLFDFDGIDSPGHFDQLLGHLWDVTEPELRDEYLDATWEMFHKQRAWNLCISGSDENWNDLTNDLSYAILDITERKKYNAPNLTVRFHRNTPEKLVHAVYKCLATGCGLPGIYNDEVVCPALERLGIPPEDSHRYVMNGCNQIDIMGKSHMGLEDGHVNLTAGIELVLRNGYILKAGQHFGVATGDPRDFESFDEFYNAYMIQLDRMIDTATDAANNAQKAYAREAPNPLRSLLIEGCIEKGLDYKNRGPLYGHGQILADGIADAVDCLAAIKKYVYEDKLYTMDELIRALDADFEGYDDMYHTLKNSELKFGNDIKYVDDIAKDVVDYFNSRLLTIPTFRGGFFSGGCSPFDEGPEYASTLSALPNGRRRDETLTADSIGATPGFDTHGPTALINSCLCFDHTLPGSGFILNLKFDRDVFNSDTGESAFYALVKSYFERGGQMLTFTVISPEELLDAKVHPENHRDLIVRVGGYSGYFTELNEKLQENVIARSYMTVN